MLKSSMVYREESPACRALDAVWTLAVRHDLRESLPYPTLPDGCVDLIYRVKKDSAGKVDHAALLVAGPSTGPDTFFPAAGEEFVGVRLAPGWGGLTLNVSPVELRGTFTGDGAVSSRLSNLEQRLFAMKSHTDAAHMLRSTVQSWSEGVAQSSPVLEAVRLFRVCGGRIRVDQVARHLAMSPRSLHRQVTERTGLSPKALSRIFRFRHSLERVVQGTGGSLCQIALLSGYTDQAHMTREWKLLGGMTPGNAAEQWFTNSSEAVL